MSNIEDDAPFESVLSDLETVVSELEAGALGLDESLKAYERGVKLVRAAQTRLDQMEGRLEELTQNGDVQPLDLADKRP